MSASAKTRGILFDAVRCVGCRKCAEACMAIHKFPGDPQKTVALSATAYTAVVELKKETYVRLMCRHCVQPSCASVCPVAALRKTDLGPVTYDPSRCIGCRYCMVACPFSVPRYQWDDPVPEVRKCDLCVDRLKEGKPPACVEACPAEASITGTREELLAEARRRIAEAPEEYHPHVYGETEVGGTNVLFLSPVPLEDLWPETLGEDPLPVLTARVLHKIPGIAIGGAAALLSIWWITNRRDEVAKWTAQRAREKARAKAAVKEEDDHGNG